MVGGSDFNARPFNLATNGHRQPGSAFKPFIYAAALDNGYSPASVVVDAPIEVVSGGRIWRPQNYGREFYGPSTLRRGIELSRNVMTVRLAQDMGMPLVAEYARRFGLYDELLPVLAMSLGASALKFFPAEPMGGVSYLKAIAAPYGGVEFMPTGGITAAKLPEYLAFPRVVACGGSWMAPTDWIKTGAFDRIRTETENAVRTVRELNREG
jgi:hypothetical protein